MAGDGITTLIREELGSRHYWVRHAGLKWAPLRPDAEIVERLVVIACRPVPQNANGQADRSSALEFHQSLLGLGAIGTDKDIVVALRKSGSLEVPLELAWFRAHRGAMSDSLTTETQRKLMSAETSDEELLTELVIAWASGNKDLIPLVRMVLADADPEGTVATYASAALQELGDTSEDYVRLAERLLHSKANSDQGLQALLGIGDRGLRLLADWLTDRDRSYGSRHVESVIRALYEYPKTRAQSISAAVRSCQLGQFLLDGPYEIAAEASDAGVREQILDKAFVAHSMAPMQPLRAIEGLAKFDVKRAVQALQLGLRNHPRIERELCDLFVRIAPKTAAAQLISAALTIERRSLRTAVGQALRKLEPDLVSRELLYLMTGTMVERGLAVEVAGWVPIEGMSDALSRVVNNESFSEIRLAGIAALDRHRREADVHQLLSTFPTATMERRWSLLAAILEEGDPHLLSDPDDPLWLGKVLTDDVPAALVHHANSVLRKRRKNNS